MAISKEAKELAEVIYKVYGSYTGYLFGIEPSKRFAVESIIQFVLTRQEDEREDEEGAPF